MQVAKQKCKTLVDDEVLSTCLSLLLTSKHIHHEFVDALRRKATIVLYLYLENMPECLNRFLYDHAFLAESKLLDAVKRLIVLGIWHNGEGCGGDQTNEEPGTIRMEEQQKDEPEADDDSGTQNIPAI
jgi:hypothetical protein